MSYRSLALLAAALSAAPLTSASAQTVYVAPGGVYVGAGPVYVIPAPPNGPPPNGVAPTNGRGPVVIAPAAANGPPPNGLAPSNGRGPVVIAPAAANGTQVYIVPLPANGAAPNGGPAGAYAAVPRRNGVPAPRPAQARPPAPPVQAAAIPPRPPAAKPYEGGSRCVVYGRREYCD